MASVIDFDGRVRIGQDFTNDHSAPERAIRETAPGGSTATAVGLALIAIVLWGSLVGSMLPLVLRRLGFDPATSSTPFVAALVDVTTS